MNFIFTHGWGFGPDIWGPVIARLDMKHTVTCVDLGFFLDANNTDHLPTNAVCIGHSLGVLWLLKHAPRPIKALVSICGFDRFTPHIPERTLLTMQRGLERNPMRQLEAFWKACGLESYRLSAPPATVRLKDGLEWLQSWNAEVEHHELHCPILAIASHDDQIVPYAMSCAIWGEQNLVLCEDGGHALPLTQPDWIAQQITKFIDNVTY